MASKNVRFPKENRAEKAWIIASPIFFAFRRGEMQKKRHFDFWRFAKAKRTKKAWTNVSPNFFRQADVRFAKAKRNRQKNPKRGQSRFQFFLRFAEAKRTKTQRMCISLRRNAKNAHVCDAIQRFNKAKPTFFTNLSQLIQIRHAELFKKLDTLSRTVRQLPSQPSLRKLRQLASRRPSRVDRELPRCRGTQPAMSKPSRRRLCSR